MGCGLDANLAERVCMLQSFMSLVLFMFAAYGVTVCGNCSGGLWEEAVKSKRKKKKKGSCYTCAKGQVLDASALTAKSHLRQKKARMSGQQKAQNSTFRTEKSQMETRKSNRPTVRACAGVCTPLTSYALSLVLHVCTAERHVDPRLDR